MHIEGVDRDRWRNARAEYYRAADDQFPAWEDAEYHGSVFWSDGPDWCGGRECVSGILWAASTVEVVVFVLVGYAWLCSGTC